MRGDGQILLIACYELGHPPHGITLPAAFLRRAGFHPDLIDLSRDPLTEERVSRARLILLSVPMHTALRLGVRAAASIKAWNRTAHLCFAGLYARLNAEHLLAGPADSILSGELEDALVDLAGALESARPLDSVAGLHLPNRPAVPILRRLEFPAPDRGGLRPLSEYAGLASGDGKLVAGYVEASRGCRHLCRHCPIVPVYAGRFFVIPQEQVLLDIRRQVAAGARHITFGDPDFLNGPGHSLAVARAMHREHPGVSFDFTAKIEHLLRHRESLPELAGLGCAFVVSAVESLSDRVLTILDKGHTRSDVEAALGLMDSAGIPLRPSLVPFTPWSTLADYEELLDFVEERGLVESVDPVQFSVRLLLPPGSRLLEHPDMAPHLGALEPESFSYAWTHPEPRMDTLHRRVVPRVETAAHQDEEPSRTLRAIRELLCEVGDRPLPATRPPAPLPLRRRPPRLTESWFC